MKRVKITNVSWHHGRNCMEIHTLYDSIYIKKPSIKAPVKCWKTFHAKLAFHLPKLSAIILNYYDERINWIQMRSCLTGRFIYV